MHDPVDLVRLVLLVVGATLVVARLVAAPGDPGGRGLLVPMLVVGVLGLAAYPRFGLLRSYGDEAHAYHVHDLWHYAQGARYYPELGYSRLYACTWVAAEELREAGHDVPDFERIRRLDAIMTVIEVPEEADGLASACHDAFSPPRWAQFRRDTHKWFRAAGDTHLWREMLLDLGFNPPPTWSVVGHTVADLVPFSQQSFELLPAIDFTLVFGVGAAAVLWAFGPWALAAYWLVLGCNYAADFMWTGGSFCRHLWAAFLFGGLASLHRRRFTAAGVLLGLATCMRVFPAVFLVGAALALVRTWWVEGDRRPLQQLVVASAATGVALGLMSLAMFGVDPWFAFFEKIRGHGATYFVNHIGFKKWATFSMEATARSFGGPEGLTRMAEWNTVLDAAWHRHALTNQALRGGLLALAGLVAWRRPPVEAAILVGAAAIFFLTMPANYYTLWLAIVPAVWLAQDGGRFAVARFVAFFGMLVGFMLAGALGDYDPFVTNYWWNRAMFGFVAVWIVTGAAELPWRGGQVVDVLRAHRLAASAIVVGGVAAWAGLRDLARDHRPNLVLVTVEGLRADAVDRDTTPHLRRIGKRARRGTVRYTADGADALRSVLSVDGASLGAHLADQGFNTMAATSTRVPWMSASMYRTATPARPRPISAQAVTDTAVDHLQRTGPDRPFFLWVHHTDPAPTFLRWPHEPEAPTPAERYALEVARVDRQLNRLQVQLREAGLVKDTWLVIVGVDPAVVGTPTDLAPLWVVPPGGDDQDVGEVDAGAVLGPILEAIAAR